MMKTIEVVAAIIYDGKGRIIRGELTLKEHEAARWLAQEELDSVDWLPADRQIIGAVSSLPL